MKRNILVVDDEKTFQFSAQIALRRAGYRTEAAGDGEEALGKILDSDARDDPFDLLVLDIRMPRMSGVELIDELIRRGKFIPTIVISSFLDRGLIRELESKGCSTILEKPFPPQELVGTIEDTLSKLATSTAQED
ncbi:MAG: response regulator [Deltaproteobacteria bacterium]|nr:response regulator [Deltaproteobacteria bacterium]PWB65652.1 MAG: two-component system response regulator [Deltaproteobacteria bacterium]